MLNDILRRSNKTLAALLLGASTFLLQSCGGGGTSSDTGLRVGDLSIIPATGTLYAGVPFEITVAGGTGPYRVNSNEPTVLPTNFTLNGNIFTVVPNNPGVVDPNSDPNVVPSRTVIVTVRDNAGTEKAATYNVLQNFMTGYGIKITSISTCGSTGTEAVAACAGFESRVDVDPTSAGLLRAQRQLRFSVLYGPLGFIQDNNTTLASTYLLTTDSNGAGTARFVPTAGAGTQFAAIRVTDVQTSAYRDIPFLLLGAPTGPLTPLPAILPALVGSTTLQCGGGQGSIVVTGGTPPYTATTTNPFITVSPASVTASGGSFNVVYGGGLPPNCSSGQVVITDAAGAVVAVAANSTPGTTAPVLPLVVSPNAFCLADGQTGAIQVTGGQNAKVLNSSNQVLATAAPTTNTGNFAATITATGVGPMVAPFPVVTISVNDGGSSANVAVTRKNACP